MRLFIFVLLACIAVGYAFWVYARVELAVRSGRVLAAVRAASLLMVLLLLFDPRMPRGAGEPAPERWLLVDASLSMADVWTEAGARAAELERDGWRTVMFGDGLLEGGLGGGDGLPTALSTRLSRALDRAAEAGAERVRVLSDLRLQDGVQVRASLASLPIEVSFEPLGSGGVNAGLGELVVPDAAHAEARAVRLEIFGSGVDSADVEVREEGRLVAQERVALPAAGLRRQLALDLPRAEGEGRLRYTARVVASGDGFPSDDEAVAYATVGREEGALVFVALSPDWEARYLLPVLARVTGLRARGYLRVGPDRFVTMGRAIDRSAALDSAEVRGAADEAALLVIQGVSGRLDPWARALVRSARARSLILASDGKGAGLAGLAASGPRDGEWYASPEVPASPLAGDLSGVRLEGLPPLTDVVVPSGQDAGMVPLRIQLGGMGAAEPALTLRASARGRQVVTLAGGFWRWAARDGAGRDAYTSLWSGVAGWLLRDDGAGRAPRPRPAEWVFDRGEPASFLLPGDSTRPLRVHVQGAAGVALDTMLESPGTKGVGVLAPGMYDYSVSDEAGAELASGRFDVAARTDEMLPARFVPPETRAAVGSGGGGEAGGRPLRTMAWPYLFIIVLLSIEWVARRRAGLR